MQSHDTSGAEEKDHVALLAAREDGAERSAPRPPTTVHGAGVRRADVLDRMFDDAAAEDTELLERLAL